MSDTTTEPFEGLFDSITKSERANKYLDSLSKDERTLVNDFTVWLELAIGLKADSARSYKSNLVRAVHKNRRDEELTSDERTAVRRFMEYCGVLAEIAVGDEG